MTRVIDKHEKCCFESIANGNFCRTIQENEILVKIDYDRAYSISKNGIIEILNVFEEIYIPCDAEITVR